METEVDYLRRRAFEERAQSRGDTCPSAKLAHVGRAEFLESLARAVEAEKRRRSFPDANSTKRGTGAWNASGYAPCSVRGD